MISETEITDQWTLISDCITKPDESTDALDLLTVEMFTEPGCRDVYNAFLALKADDLPTDINHTLERLETTGRLTRELVSLLHDAARQERAPQPVLYYAQRVLNHHRKRSARGILLRHHQNLVNGQGLPETLTELHEDLDQLHVDLVPQDVRRRPEIASKFRPFPIDALPNAVKGFVKATASAIGCDASFVVLPMLAAVASAIGTTRKLTIKRGWTVPAIIWAIGIGESGTQKSPPMRAVLKPLQMRQNEWLSKFASELAAYKRELQSYRKNSRKAAEGTMKEPEPPICERCLVSDTTLEALVPILQQNPRGVLLARDEVGGWFGSFDRYSGKGNASADVAQWLSIYNADCAMVDRKTGDKTTLFVPEASVSICGTIQPGILNRVLTSEHRENGLAARLLMSFPPRTPKQWRDDEIPRKLEEQWADLVTELFEFKHDLGANGKQKSAIVNLSDESRALFADFVNKTGDEQTGLTGDLAAAWSKLEEIPARMALLIHCIRQASSEPVDAWVCDTESMSAALTIGLWFKDETQRIYELLKESKEHQYLRQLSDWIRQKGNSVRIRDLVSGRRDVPDAEQAESLMRQLVDAGYGFQKRVPPGQRGGRSTMEFVLYPAVTEQD